MLDSVQVGEKRHIEHVVQKQDFAGFLGEVVHPVYSTFALGRDAEWACRQFVLELKEEDEEGVGTFLNIEHESPAFEGEKVVIEAVLQEIKSNQVICSFVAKVDNRVIAKGTQGQKVLKKEKVNQLLRRHEPEG